MSDFDFNVNFIGPKPSINSNIEEPGDILSAAKITSIKLEDLKNTNKIVLARKFLPGFVEPMTTFTNIQPEAKPIATSKFDSKETYGKFKSKIGVFITTVRANSPRFKNNYTLAVVTVGALLTSGLILTTIFAKSNTTVASKKEVAGAFEKIRVTNEPTEAYKSWVTDKLGSYAGPNEDADADGLTNDEEFMIGSDPNNSHSCNPNKTDAQNLIELINPVTCQPIDVNDTTALEKYKKLVNFDAIHSKIVTNIVSAVEPDKKTSNTSLSGVFGVNSLESLNKVEFSDVQLKTELEAIKVKQGYISKINKINQYMKETRSLEPFDRNLPIPVSGSVYLQVSQDYNTPLKYVLAVAQRESRFGTDVYDKDGNLTRPGKYKNIFSIGLDDSGNNIGFETWEKGVVSFGKWYKNFQDRGVSDCNKWRIYNPNGDYCKSIEETASQIDYYLNR